MGRWMFMDYGCAGYFYINKNMWVIRGRDENQGKRRGRCKRRGMEKIFKRKRVQLSELGLGEQIYIFYIIKTLARYSKLTPTPPPQNKIKKKYLALQKAHEFQLNYNKVAEHISVLTSSWCIDIQLPISEKHQITAFQKSFLQQTLLHDLHHAHIATICLSLSLFLE